MFAIMRTAMFSRRNALSQAFALIAGGVSDSTVQSSSVKYDFSAATVSPGANLTRPTRYAVGTGNTTLALFAGGSALDGTAYSQLTELYKYASNSVVSGGALADNNGYAGAISSNTLGVIGAGTDSSASVAKTYLYPYDTNVTSVGASLGQARYGLAGASTTSYGIFGSGQPVWTEFSTRVDRYTYSSNTVVADTSLGVGRRFLGAAGNAETAIFAGGSNGANSATLLSHTDRFTYANSSVATGSALSLAREYIVGAGNSEMGLFTGGSSAAPTGTRVDKYTYTTNTCVAATNLDIPRQNHAAASSTPGHLAG